MDKEKYRNRLQEDHTRLLAEIEEGSKPEDFGNDVDSLDEEANEGEATANRLAIVQSLKERVNEIEDALRRIDADTYGVCAKCGQAISEEVLDAAPESAICPECKKKEAKIKL